MSAESVWLMVVRATAFALVLQNLEMLSIWRRFPVARIWSWSVLEREYCRPLRMILRCFLHESAFPSLLLVGAGLAGVLAWQPTLVVALAVLLWTWLVCARWRGTFNGGSDYMTFVLLGGILVGLMNPADERYRVAGLAYIALQTILSYVLAGFAKIRNPAWRSGAALRDFLVSSPYEVPAELRQWAQTTSWLRGLSWVFLLWEISFPLALWNMSCAGFYLFTGALFHGLNSYALGLNRFWWMWLAAYPAVCFFVRA